MEVSGFFMLDKASCFYADTGMSALHFSQVP